MRGKAAVIFSVVLALNSFASDGFAGEPNSIELVRYEEEYSSAHVEPARMGSKAGIAVIFEGTEGLHYYAKAGSAPAAGFELKVEAKSDDFEFGEAVSPKWDIFVDPLGNKAEVYAGEFAVFVPIKTVRAATKRSVIEESDVEVRISGQACTAEICLQPFEKRLRGRIDWSQRDLWREISFEKAGEGVSESQWLNYSMWFALVLAFLAGLSLNIMPCVWPVLPLIVMRIVAQAKTSRSRSVVMGLAFCFGILLFFGCLAGANVILQVFYGTVLQWGDQFRNPVFVALLALLLVVLALFMFDVFTISVPSTIASKTGSGKGYAGAAGMGFLAAILSTPCSFAILAAAFAWAQSQRLLIATIAIMFIGIGMAFPYGVLTSMPGLLNRLPKPGRWMELFKRTIGFVLLLIAVKLITALPEVRSQGVLYLGVILAFCVWMWGGWVDYNTKRSRKWLIRIIAVVLAVAGGWVYLPLPAAELIEWQPYSTDLIETAKAQQRPVLIKFTADWCMSCVVVEKIVYAKKEIAELIEDKGVLAIKADTTVINYPATVALKNVYNEPGGVPVSMLFLPGSDEPVRWHGISFANELKSSLEQLTSK